ncbi:hypothetical protein BB561_001580 [Smittium simulii]|uniref:Ras-related protein Rab-18 n=1 Tax=Smittium simulii TaxID=133385 RepID=A0A2T9YTZ4_9FUNG|nr:hypothetical protein BB561_001580 [Smittium simulii]
MSKDIAATFKLLMVGDSGVGKSSILLRFTDDEFLPSENAAPTIGVDFKIKFIELDEKKYKLTIWDTAGQERFRTLTSSYYRGAQGVILVYDVSDKNSFESLGRWLEELDTYCTRRDVVKIIIGNKIDKGAERVIKNKEGASFARQNNALFLECSAKTQVGVVQAVEELVYKIIENPALWASSSKNGIQVTDQESDKSASDCYC